MRRCACIPGAAIALTLVSGSFLLMRQCVRAVDRADSEVGACLLV